jgi:hypothetical protein
MDARLDDVVILRQLTGLDSFIFSGFEVTDSSSLSFENALIVCLYAVML